MDKKKFKPTLSLLDQLEKKYNTSRSFHNRFLFFRKRASYLLIIGTTKALKRVFDLIGSIFLLILLSPLFLVVSLLIFLIDRHSVIYVSKRVGMYGEEFTFYKFRTMYHNSDQLKEDLQSLNEDKSKARFKIRNDPRVTALGRVLRRFSIDELPQLYCVFLGYMSLVGPRPPLPDEVLTYSIRERKRLEVKPGITCLWQVRGRSLVPFEKQVELDLKYIENQSFWGDIRILLQTIPAVFLGRGAY